MKPMVLLLFMVFCQLPTTDSARRLARQARQQDQDGQLDDAEVNYKRALLQQPTLYQARLNLGNTLYHQERYPEAILEYQQLSGIPAVPIPIRARAFYNLGTTYLRMGRLQESKSALQAALRLHPADRAAQYNLSFVIKSISEPKQVKPSEKKAADGETATDLDAAGTSQKGEFQKEARTPDRRESPTPSPESAEQMLQALDLMEQSLLDKARRQYQPTRKAKVDKDW